MAQSLRQSAVNGALWASAFTGVSKIVSLISQLLLAWILVPEDFGVVAMANSFISLVTVLQTGGVRTVLVRRQNNFPLWAGPAFWLCTAQGALAALIGLISSPLIARYYSQGILAKIVPIMALGVFIDSLAIVPAVRLQVLLRFKTIGVITTGGLLIQGLLSVFLARSGFGALSLVLPKIPVAASVTAVLWANSGVKVCKKIKWRKWKYIFSDSLYMVAAWGAFAVANQVPLSVIGRSYGVKAAGLYAFAANLTTQIISLFTAQLDGVLFPILAKYRGYPRKQWDGFVQATSLLAFVVFALHALQFVLAGAVITTFFSSRWFEAIAIVKILCVGNAVLAAAIPTGGAMQAMGKIRVYAGFAGFSLITCVVIIFSFDKIIQRETSVVYGAIAYQISISLVAWIIVKKLYEAESWDWLKNIISLLFANVFAAWLTHIVTAQTLSGGGMKTIATTVGVFCFFWLAVMWAFCPRSILNNLSKILTVFYEKKRSVTV